MIIFHEDVCPQGKEEDLCVCKICGKDVYQMEKVKAVKSTFHRSCFRCKECNKQLRYVQYTGLRNRGQNRESQYSD